MSAVDKLSIRCPISAIRTFQKGSESFAMWANGGNIICNSVLSDSTMCGRVNVFNTNTVRGITISSEINKYVAFGEKSVVVCALNNISQTGILVRLDSLDDLVLDCCIQRGNDDHTYLIIGYAHNFIDVYQLSPESPTLFLNRIQCPGHRSLLFSMSLFPNPDNSLLVASGSVFGKLTIWTTALLSAGPGETPSPKLLHTASAHEGVVFRIVWSPCGTRMLTCSDDRTARLWAVTYDTGTEYPQLTLTELFVAWGHVSRVWDAVFLSMEGRNVGDDIATCSEDGTVKLWDTASGGGCVSTLRGHRSDVWRISTAFNSAVLVSSGNDASIKIWDLDFHGRCSPTDPAGAMRTLQLPCTDIHSLTPASGGVGSASHKRVDSVCFVKVSPDGLSSVVVMVDGTIWYSEPTTAYSGDERWSLLGNLNKTVSTANVSFVDCDSVSVVVACQDGKSTLLQVSVTRSSDNGVVGAVCSGQFEWRPHTKRTMNIWFAGPSCDHIATSSLDGACTLWRLKALVTGDHKTYTVERVTDFITGHKKVATSCCLAEKNGECDANYLVLGDNGGGVSVFKLGGISEDRTEKQGTEDSSRQPDQFFPRAHIFDIVSCITAVRHGFVTAGHDGQLCIFRHVYDSMGDIVGWEIVNRMPTLPVSIPDQLVVIEPSPTDGTGDKNLEESSVIVCGYAANLYMIWDVAKSYQILRIAGSGWKRPHHCVLAFSDSSINVLPSVTFMCQPLPSDKSSVTTLAVFHCKPSRIYARDATHSDAGDGGTSSLSLSLPFQLCSSSLGRVAYCAALIPCIPHGGLSSPVTPQYVVVGGHEGIVKVLRCPDLTPCQETVLSCNASLKALATASGRDANAGVVVGGGGKLIYCIWTYDLRSCERRPLTQILTRVCERKLWTRATQDHRILSVQCVYLGDVHVNDTSNNEHYMVVFGDSRGVLTVGMLTCGSSESGANSQQFEVREELRISEFPLLSLNMCVLSNGSIICCCGDTAGVNSLWLLSGTRINRQSEEQTIEILGSRLLCSYVAHTMGSNAVCIRQVISGKVEDTDTVRFVVASGGDDQALSCCSFALSVCGGPHEQSVRVDLRLEHVCRNTAAAGSALKGVKLLPVRLTSEPDKTKTAALHCVTVGYDQRLTLWELSRPNGTGETVSNMFTSSVDVASGRDGSAVWSTASETASFRMADFQDTWSLRWVAGYIVNIGDVGALDVATNNDKANATCVVVGEGFQLLDLRF